MKYTYLSLAVATVLASSTPAAPSLASQSDLLDSDYAVELVSNVPDSYGEADTLQKRSGTIVESTPGSDTTQGQVTIPTNPDNDITYTPSESDGQEVNISLPQNLDLTPGVIADSTYVAFHDKNANAAVTAEIVEGGVRLHSVTGSKSSPHSFDYDIELPPGTTWEQYEDYSIVFTDSNGELLSAIAPPWALDAAGQSIPTTFEFDGATLTQHILPDESQSVAYPVVADPYKGKKLFHNLNTKKKFKGLTVYSGTKTKWGQKIHNGQASAPEGWLGGVIAGQKIMRNEGWSEWKNKWPAITNKKSLYQQYSCHVAGGFYNWAGDWNLERARPNKSAWAATVAAHRCNWS